MIPCVSNGTLKLITSPTGLDASFMYVRSWGFMDWQDTLNRLQFDDNLIADD